MPAIANSSVQGQLEAYSVCSFLSDFSVFKIILNDYVDCVFCW